MAKPKTMAATVLGSDSDPRASLWVVDAAGNDYILDPSEVIA
jgi:hypothetical protein